MKKPDLKILYIDGVGPFGGASRSLYELVSYLTNQGSIKPYFIATKGTSVNFYRKLTGYLIETRGLFRFDHTDYSYYRGIRWLAFIREVTKTPFTLFALIIARYRWGKSINIIHCNEITEIIPSILAKLIFQAPLVIHVRSVQCNNSKLLRTKLLHVLLRKYADKIIAIDNTVRKSLPKDLSVTVIHNSFSAKHVTHPATDDELEITQHTSFKVGFVGNLQVSKGVIELVKAAAIIKQKQKSNIEFIFIGGKTHHHTKSKSFLIRMLGLEQDIFFKIKSIVKDLNCEDTVHLIGHKDDIHRYYPRFNLLVFPSHFDAPGRPVFEAAFYKVPCIVCIRNPESDTIINQETGICIPYPEPNILAQTILWFYENPQKTLEMGVASQKLAVNNFSPQKNSMKTLEIYNQLTLYL